jgi:hypothetical protein
MARNPFQFDTFAEDSGALVEDSGAEQLTPVSQKPAASADPSVIEKLTQQILSRGTVNWTGEGFGSPEANARDMAKILSGIGITDVSQFGKFTQTGLQEDVRPDGRGGFVNLQGKPVDASLVTPVEVEGMVSYTAPTGTQEVFGNKATKQAVPNTYSERQTGNFFGGTFAGGGNTGYGVQFDPQGNPIFFTQGASSADVAGNPLVALTLAVVLPGVGVAIGETLGISSAAGTAIAKVSVSVAMGQPLDVAIKDAAISSIVQTGSVDAAKEIVSAGADPKIANAIASVGGSIVQTAARGGDASDILTNAVAAAGASSLISADVSPTIAKAVGVALSGGTAEQVISSLASSVGGTKEVKNPIASALLPTEPPEAPAVTPVVTPEVTPPVEPAAPPETATFVPEAPPTPAPTVEPTPTVEVTAPTAPPTVEQTILDLIKKDAEPETPPAPVAEVPAPPPAPVTTPEAPAPAPEQPAPPAAAEEVKVTAPAEKTAEQQILDLIKPKEPEVVPTPAPEPAPVFEEVAPTPAPEAPAPVQPVEEVKVSAPAEKTPDQAIIDLITPKAPEIVAPVEPTPAPPVVPEEVAQPTPSPVEEVKITAPAEKTTEQQIIDLIAPKAPEPAPVVEPAPEPPVIPETPVSPAPAPVEEVKVTAPAEKNQEQAIIDLITPQPEVVEPPPAPVAPPVAPVEEVEITGKKEEQPVIVDTTQPPLIEPTPPIAAPAPVAPIEEIQVTEERPVVTPENQPILDLIAPTETPTVPEIAVTAPREEEVRVTARPEEVPIIDTTTPPAAPEEIVITAPREEEVKITAKPEEVPIIDTVIPDLTAPTLQPEQPVPEEEPEPEKPYKPQITIFGGVPGKRRTLPQTLQAPFYPSTGLTQALTAQRGAGEIEGDPSGKPRKNVWNEASLRLKDALGL